MYKGLIHTNTAVYQHHYDGNKNTLVKLPCNKCDIVRCLFEKVCKER